ncbi:MAG: hypothetical protein V3T72_22570, partial [Thermoanaerobaculia bacterium]
MNHCRRPSPFPALLSIVALSLLAAVPALAYTVFLQDGTQIIVKEKYHIEGDRAILTLPSGTRAFYQAAEIDVAKTEEFNKVDYGTAKVIEGKETRTLADDELLDDKVTLTDLLNRRGRTLTMPEPQRRDPDSPTPAELDDGELAASVPRTKAGFADLFEVPRDPYPKPTILSEVMRYLKGQGWDNIRLYRGTRLDRPLVEIVAASEASVFKAMKDAANSLVQIHERFPEDVGAFELLLVTDNQLRAGQFTLTPELANMLVTEELDPASF